jgi:hypothetical protein
MFIRVPPDALIGLGTNQIRQAGPDEQLHVISLNNVSGNHS